MVPAAKGPGLRLFAAGALLLAASCGGGGGGSSGPPPATAPGSGLTGALDASYGTAGRASFLVADFPTGEAAFAADGSAYVAANGGVRKLDASGNVIATLPGAGKLRLDSSGNLYVADEADVRKYDSQAQLIGSFPTVPLPGSNDPGQISGFAVEPGGSSYVIRDTTRASTFLSHRVTAAKFDREGARVAAYGENTVFTENGIVLQAASSVNAFAVAAIADAGGNLYSASRVYFSAESFSTSVLKYNAAGSPVREFASSGSWDWPRQGCATAGLALDGRGGLLVLGACPSPSGTSQSAVARLDASGAPATDFSSTGIRERLFGETATLIGEAHAAAVGPDGTVYVGGYVRSTTPGSCPSAVVAALGPSGFVSSFGTQGIAMVAGTDVNRLAFDGQGRLYVGSLDIRPSSGTGCGASPPYQQYFVTRLR